MKHRFIGILLVLMSCARCAFAQFITIDNSNTYSWEIPTNVVDSITPTVTDSLCVYFHDGNTFFFSYNNVRNISTTESVDGYDNENDHKYVDLGLSVMWATCNIGASKPEENGGYFAWGETEEKITYSRETYKYYARDGWITKYCIDSWAAYGHHPDAKTVLEPTDDVAHVKWGGSWRMPTDAEWSELLSSDNCTWTWMTEGNTKGYKVESKSNGNSIFLPAAGCRDNFSQDIGSNGFYWSSSLYRSNNIWAWSVDFTSGYGRNYILRYYGQSVRPVCHPIIHVTSVSLDKTSLSLTEGVTSTLTATIAPSNATDKSVSWSSSNTSVATVSSTGVVSAKSVGTATITVQTNDGSKKAVCTVIVSSGPSQLYSYNDSICERDGFTNLTNIKASDYNTTKTRFKTVRLDLSNGQGNTDGNYVSVILHNLSTGSTYWSTNRIQTISKSVGRQICDNNSREMDITEVGHLVPGSDDLYEYTFSSFMEIYEIDKYVIKSMIWLKLE